MSDNSSGSRANLARIRDNQRRSRARRKEYLEELESKYRACEQMGVEASAEMQAAARKVLDENRKLRALLKTKGLSDEEIDSFMGETEMSNAKSSACGFLDTILHTRKPCCPDNVSCEPSTGTSPQPLQSLTSSLHPNVTPLSSHSVSLSPQSGIIGSAMPSPNPMVFSPTTLDFSSQGVAGGSSQTITAYLDDFPDNSYWQPYEMDDSSSALPTFGNTSCVDAANIIRTMRGDVGPELENDLGCQQPGTNCKVENLVVFDLMEKYTTRSMDP